MKKIILTLYAICHISLVNGQSKNDVIQELNLENAKLKSENSNLNGKINSLQEIIENLKKELIVDKVETPQDYGKTLFNLLKAERLAKYPELQFQLKDSIYFNKKGESFKEIINKIKDNAIEFYLKGSNNGIDWSKTEFQKTEFDINKPNSDLNSIHLNGYIYFKYLDKNYRFVNEGSILENGKWRGYSFRGLVNLTEEAENEKIAIQEKLKAPYIPYKLKIGEGSYTFTVSNDEPKRLSSIKIPIENNTNYNINWIKFNLKVFDSGELILSKNIIISTGFGLESVLEPGEKEIVEIQEIEGLFINSGVMNKKWSIETELIEAQPKQIED